MIVFISCSTWLNSKGDSAPFWLEWDYTLYQYIPTQLETGMLYSLFQFKRGKFKNEQHSVALETLIIYAFIRERLTGAPHLCFSRGKEGSTQHASSSQLPEAGDRDGREDLRIFWVQLFCLRCWWFCGCGGWWLRVAGWRSASSLGWRSQLSNCAAGGERG